MEKLKDFTNKYRHILCMLAILVVSVVVFGWVGMLTLRPASEKSERAIVNDDYSVITQEIRAGDGIRQKIQVKGGTRLYGVSANFHIFNRVQYGTVFAEILDTEGNLLASAQDDMTTIKDNTFKGFIFDNCIQPAEDSEYIFHLYIQPATEEDRIALWKSEGTYTGFELAENGAETDGTLALQYIVRHVGKSIYGFYALISGIAIVGAQLLYLLIFVKKCRPETAFATAALIVGMIFCLFTPISGGPDEYAHISSAYVISNDIVGEAQSENYYRLRIRQCDNVMNFFNSAEYTPFDFQDTLEGLTSVDQTPGEFVEISARKAGHFKLSYIAMALGMSLARVLNLGFVPLIMLGRFFNLLYFIAVVWLAVKIMPVYKTTLALCGLLPMCLQLGGAFNYDPFITSVGYLFIASVFRIAYKEGKAKITDWILPAVTLCLLTPIKPIYIVMGLLVYIVPNSKFNNKKLALFTKTAVLCIGVIFWFSLNIQSVMKTLKPRENPSAVPSTPAVTQTVEEIPEEPVTKAEDPVAEKDVVYPFDNIPKEPVRDESLKYWDPNGDLMPNGDSKYYFSISYVLSHLRQTIKLVMNTITHESGKYIRTMIGTRLGEIIIIDLTASPLILMAIIMVLLLSMVNVRGKEINYPTPAKWLGAFIFVCVVGLTVAACIMWTPINYEIIFGIQGRYFLPALPLMVMFFANKFIILEKNIDGILIYSMLPLNILVILNVFIIMCK